MLRIPAGQITGPVSSADETGGHVSFEDTSCWNVLNLSFVIERPCCCVNDTLKALDGRSDIK